MPRNDFELVQRAIAQQQAVTLAPHFPGRDEYFQPIASRSMSIASEPEIPKLLGVNQAAITQAVKNAKRHLNLAHFELDGADVHATLFTSSDRTRRVGFLINPSTKPVTVAWRLKDVKSARDALTEVHFDVTDDTLKLSLAEQSVTMLELVSVS
jgi:hypothetical protein